MKNYKMFCMFSVICLIIFCYPSAPQAAKFLDFGDPVGGPPDVPVRMAFEFFCKEVASRTNGEIIIKYHPKTLVSDETRAMDMCRSGSIAFTEAGASFYSYFPMANSIRLPFLFRNDEHFYAVVRGPIGKEIEKTIEKNYNLKLVFWIDWGFRQLVNNKRPINKPEDLAGLKLRVVKSKLDVDTINALGATAVPMSWAETIPAIQQGVVDGLDLALATLATFRMYEVIKYVSVTSHINSGCAAFANLKVWNDFTFQQQKIILQAGQDAADFLLSEIRAKDLSGTEILKKNGVQIIYPDIKPFRDRVEKVIYPNHYEKYGRELIDRINAVK
jgi:tripartite ATP-independent transporter DctP family solute receptor